MSAGAVEWRELALQVARLRPLVHAMQNTVTSQWVAAGLLAAGASPIMARHPAEAALVAARADALVLNLGTWSPEVQTAMLAAGAAAAERGIPIVLDPVGAGFLATRTQAALELLERLPVDVVRANLGEVQALTGTMGRVRGVDSVDSVDTVDSEAPEAAAGSRTDQPGAAAARAAARHGVVVACTGPTDHVAAPDGRVLAIGGGHPLLAAVPGTGCLASALVAALAAVSPDAFSAAAAALNWLRWAGARAAGPGPGSFAPALLDALYAIRSEEP